MRMRLSRFRFETKLNLGILAIVLGMAVFLLPVVARMTSSALIAENKLRGVALAESLAARAVNPLLARDYLTLRNLVGETGDVVYAFVMNADGRVVTHSFLKGFPVELSAANAVDVVDRVHVQLIDTGEILIYDFAAPILVSGERIGTVRVGLVQISAERHHQAVRLGPGHHVRRRAPGRHGPGQHLRPDRDAASGPAAKPRRGTGQRQPGKPDGASGRAFLLGDHEL